ncbi:MAG: bifunctional folylpolyglutamate synthase/dihydrofolate synthase [Candidatus Aminicenantes bacterium]|nr:MAG: bifunctional folylpolyglutamate synthase/dihydrofolate synthase [Candidatus Aminicenantes bacterium]
MNYEQCLKYLEKIQNLGIKFGLDNVRTLLSSFGNPHTKFASVLVAGTNGKGSVCAMLTETLALHNFRAGLFTSPHLVRVEERIRIGRALIPTQSFCNILTSLKEKIEELIAQKKLLSPPTYFELLTCLALLYFEKQKVDMAILEVGMGGRFDATNVVNPVLSVITTISREHQKFLGQSLSQIAFEKAGIIKPDVPVVCGVEASEAYETIKKRARELEAPFLGVFDRKNSFQVQKAERKCSFIYETKNNKYWFSPSLQGEHQGRNAAVVITAAEQLSENWKKLEQNKIVEGIEKSRWEGRLEVVSRDPLVILDGAHNEEGALALRKYIKDFIPSPLILIFAIMRDKEVENVVDILFPMAERIILTRFPYFRASSPEEIKEKASGFQDRVVLEPNVNRAIDLARRSVGPKGSILVAGSLYLVGEIKKYLSLDE